MQPTQPTSQPGEPVPQATQPISQQGQTIPQPGETTPLPAQTAAIPQQDLQAPAGSAGQDRTQQRMDRRTQHQAAGVPVWGVLLILVGAIALFGNVGINLGWIFGLALGAWFVYLGVRHTQEGQPVNWWLVGIGLLIGLGAITNGSGFANNLVFPGVLILVGLGILAEHYLLTRPDEG